MLNYNLDEFLNSNLDEFKKELNNYDDWINAHEKISNTKYPDRLWTNDFKNYVREMWIDKQEEHKERVIQLYTELLILYYEENNN